MNCTEFEILLNEQFENRTLGEPPDVPLHRAECESCRALAESMQTLSDAIGCWRESTPEIDLGLPVVTRQLRNRLAATELPSGTRRESRQLIAPHAERALDSSGSSVSYRAAAARTRWTLVASLASLAAILIVSSVPSFDDPDELAARRARQSVNLATHAAGRQHDQTMAPAAVATEELPYLTLGRQAGEVLAGLFVPGSASTGRMTPEGGTADENNSWLGGFQSQWEPVGESLGNALDFLWQAGDAHDSART